jgi:hypothetical protein
MSGSVRFRAVSSDLFGGDLFGGDLFNGDLLSGYVFRR